MTQNRPPPAFQEYAPNMLARAPFRLASLLGRGLLYTMRLECWVNHGLPENPAELSKFLGLDLSEVKAALPSVMPFFDVQNGLIICPELEDYRSHLEGVRAKQAAGGKKGASKTNAKHKTPESKAAQGVDDGSGNSRVTRPLTRDSLVKSSSVQSSTTQPLKKDFPPEKDPFVAEMEAAEARDPFARYQSNEYRKASDGE